MNANIEEKTFAPLVAAEREYWAKLDNYRKSVAALRDLVQAFSARIQADKNKMSAALDALDEEEAKLRAHVREQAQTAIMRRISGQQPPESDLSAGARLAVIPEERAAIEALMSSQGLTEEEREQYEDAYDDARAATSDAEAASNKRWAEFSSVLKTLETVRKAGSIPNLSLALDDIQQSVYRLTPQPEQTEYVTPYGVLKGGHKL